MFFIFIANILISLLCVVLITYINRQYKLSSIFKCMIFIAVTELSAIIAILLTENTWEYKPLVKTYLINMSLIIPIFLCFLSRAKSIKWNILFGLAISCLFCAIFYIYEIVYYPLLWTLILLACFNISINIYPKSRYKRLYICLLLSFFLWILGCLLDRVLYIVFLDNTYIILSISYVILVISDIIIFRRINNE